MRVLLAVGAQSIADNLLHRLMHIQIVETVAQPRLPCAVDVRGNEFRPARIMPIEVLDDHVDSGTVWFRASSASTGNLPIGHSFNSAARSLSLERSTILGVNDVSFSYSAISTLWQYDARG